MWVKPSFYSIIRGYDCVHRDRHEGSGGGYAFFVQNGIQHRIAGKLSELVFIVIKVWTIKGLVRVNFYNLWIIIGKYEGDHRFF